MPDNPSKIDAAWLGPFASFTVLQCSADPTAAVAQLVAFILEHMASNRGHPVRLLASGIDGIERLLRPPGIDGSGHDQVEALLYRRDRPPSWAGVDSPYTDVEHHVLVALRRGALVAVQGEPEIRDSIWRWVHGAARPPFRGLHPAILYGAFCRGAARSLWLMGTHPRRTTKADNKRLSGQNLVEALNPLEDASYAPGSVRARLPLQDGRQVLGRDVGTTARRGGVWLRATRDFADFLNVASHMLEMVEETIASGSSLEQPFPLLAAELEDLTGVNGAYELGIPGAYDIEGGTDPSQDVLDAAEFLQGCLLRVHPLVNSPNFAIEVGTEGVIRGQLRCSVTSEHGRARLSFGFANTSTSSAETKQIHKALEQVSDWIAVYYLSGHSVRSGGIFLHQIRDMPFEHWSPEDFAGWKVMREKPGDTPEDIHRLAGSSGDDSLFGWVVHHYQSGWLTCDDGSGEVADFIHLAPDGTLSLVHVKAATNDTPERQVSASAYEVVASQASKNLGFLNAEAVRIRLSDPQHNDRATWHDGVREPDRTGFLASLAARSYSAPLEVIIVQPHVRQARIDALRTAGMPGEDGARLKRLEALLNSTAGGVLGVGARFRAVISC